MVQKKIKIAFMIPGLGRIKRGSEVFPTVLAEKLSSEFDVTIFALQKNHSLAKTSWAIDRNNAFLKKIFELFLPFNKLINRYFYYWPTEVECLTFSLSLLPKLLKDKYDVIFPVSIWGVMMARLIRALKGTKIIYLNHGGAENFILKQRPDIFVPWTPDLLDWARKNHLKVKSVLMPIGIDFSRFSSQITPVKLALEKPIILCVAALTPYKRIHLTIQAVAKLEKGSLLLLGEGELKQELEKLGKKLLGPKRFLLTAVPFDRMPSFYAAADVFTLASTTEEANAAACLEAMACNLPIVTINDERRRLLIGQGGILCDVEDIDLYARTLALALKRNFGDLPKNQARKNELGEVTKQYSSLIKSLF